MTVDGGKRRPDNIKRNGMHPPGPIRGPARAINSQQRPEVFFLFVFSIAFFGGGILRKNRVNVRIKVEFSFLN